MLLPLSRYKQIEQDACSLISRFKIKEAPVPVLEIAKNLSIEVIEYNLGNEASGILLVDNGKGTIGYNPSDLYTRQRFTIAHELGHYLLHCKNTKHEKVFVDKQFLIKYRNRDNYDKNEFKHEQEANAFAAALLMPEDFVFNEISKKIYDGLPEAEVISTMAKTFDVSTIAMTYRITNLNITI